MEVVGVTRVEREVHSKGGGEEVNTSRVRVGVLDTTQIIMLVEETIIGDRVVVGDDTIHKKVVEVVKIRLGVVVENILTTTKVTIHGIEVLVEDTFRTRVFM